MCGIAGFIGDFDELILYRMNQTIAHRGPDDSGIFLDHRTRVGLAHRRLSIIDLSASGRQPMWDITGKVAIVYNGEIYNYRELRSTLSEKGYGFQNHTDTEALLNLYLHHGTTMLERLNGIFAFALWDTRTDRLFLARDGVGVKPLYYTRTEKGFLFSSELKALLQESSVSKSINPLAVHHYLTCMWCPAPHTMLQGLYKLEPGHAMIIDKEGHIQRKWAYYHLPYGQTIEPLSEETAIHQVQSHLEQAVKRQMVADVPVGAFLSGGLDSSAIVAFARQAEPGQRLQCFTIGFQDESMRSEGFVDDLPYARQVAGHLDVDLHTIYAESKMVDQLETVLYHLDEPQADPAPINALLISELASKSGIKVLLSGAGGDDLFTGYRRHYALLMERYWTWLPASVRSALAQAVRYVPMGNPVGRRIARAFQYAHLEDDDRIAGYFYWISPDITHQLYTDDFRAVVSSLRDESPLIASLKDLPEGVEPLNKMLYLEGKHFLADHNLNYTDKMGMTCGVEIRVPFLDPDLIALAARLPTSFKQRGREGKWILKKAMEPYLPRSVIYRPKTGFGAPIRRWIRHDLRPMLDDVLSENDLNVYGIFDPDQVGRLRAMDAAGRVDAAYTIFSIFCIELWCRIFLSSPVRIPACKMA